MMKFFVGWKLYAAVALGVALVLALLWGLVLAYGNARYEAGVNREAAFWLEALTVAQQRADAAEEELLAANERLVVAQRERDAARRARLTHTQTEIENAPGFEERYAAYLSGRDGLRGPTAERFAGARADYLSTVDARVDRGAGSDRSELRVAFVRAGPTVHLAP